MRRENLAHLLRAASQIAEEPNIIVVGSQAILGTHDDADLPEQVTLSVEADLTFWDDTDDVKSDRVDGAIGEDSQFHATFGYYAQRVSITTATLPEGWRDRLWRPAPTVHDVAPPRPGSPATASRAINGLSRAAEAAGQRMVRASA